MVKTLLNKVRIAFLLLAAVSLLENSASAQNAKEVSGTVVDPEGMGLPGVNVLIKGTSKGTTTNINGDFRLTISEDNATLIFSFIGFTTQEKPVGSLSTIDIEMEYEIGQLQDVVITGYGQTQNEYLVSTSISRIDPEEMIQDRPISRVEGVLQGATPALVVIKESGSPGAPLTVRMRGVGTAQNATPLMLLDGFQIPDMNFLNPNDIGDISVYKDAAASSIYGSRGGNGVINVANKSGEKGKKLGVNFSSYYGVQSLASEGEYLTDKEYAEYYNNSVNYLIRQGDPIRGRGAFTDEEVSNLSGEPWIRRVTSDAPIMDHHISASMGGKNTSVYVGAGYFAQDGIIEKTSFDRTTFNLNLKTRLADRVNVSVLGIYSNSKRDFIAENSENSRLLSSVASLPAIYPSYDPRYPTVPPYYNENGQFFNPGQQGVTLMNNGVEINAIQEFGNPLAGLEHTTSKSDANTFFGNALLNIDIIDGLKFNTSYGYLTRMNDIKIFTETFENPDTQYNNPINFLTEMAMDEVYWQWEGYVSYDKKIADHDLSLVAGHSVLYNSIPRGGGPTSGRNGQGFSVNSYDSASFAYIEDESLINDFPPRTEDNTTVSYYGRVNYNFLEKYLFGATLRVDASSKFGSENQWGTYPSANVGWLISNENFLSGATFINQLKLRASWGINGSDRIPAYNAYSRYEIIGSLSNPAYNATDYNPDILWEEIQQTNVGLDVDLFENRIGMTFDWYVKETSDMLIPFPNPAYFGLPSVQRNAATARNTGFEAIFTYRDKFWDSFSININANIGVNENEVTNLNGGLPIFGAETRVFSGAPALSITDRGTPVAAFYGYQVEELDDEGNPVYRDISGPNGEPDGEISADFDRTVIGNPYPDFIYGLNVSMEFKGFDLTAFLTGTQGNDVVNASMGFGFQYSNRTRRVLNAWSLENPSSQDFRPSALEVVNHEFSDYYVEDGSYMRVKNITLGYSFPESIIEKIKLEKLRIYVSGNNLITVTDYSGYDPEIGANNNPTDVGVDRGFYPQARSIIGGIQVSF